MNHGIITSKPRRSRIRSLKRKCLYSPSKTTTTTTTACPFCFSKDVVGVLSVSRKWYRLLYREFCDFNDVYEFLVVTVIFLCRAVQVVSLQWTRNGGVWSRRNSVIKGQFNDLALSVEIYCCSYYYCCRTATSLTLAYYRDFLCRKPSAFSQTLPRKKMLWVFYFRVDFDGRWWLESWEIKQFHRSRSKWKMHKD